MPGTFVTGNSEYIRILDDPSLDVGSADFCVMCWFNISTAGDEIISKGRFADIGPGWQLRRNNGMGGQLLAVFGDGSGGFDILQTAGAISTGVWHHAAMVRDGGAGLWRLYVDGVEVDTTAIVNATGSLDSPEDLLIGAINEPTGTPTRFMDGLIDDPRFYKFAPSADLIKEIYDAFGQDETIPQPDGHWRMDEFPPGVSMSGADSIRDLSGNGNHGTPNNTPVGAEGILAVEQFIE